MPRSSLFLFLFILTASTLNHVSGQSTSPNSQTKNINSSNSSPSNESPANAVSVESKAQARKLVTYGNNLLESGQFSEAIEQLQQAVKLDPEYADAYSALGRAYFKVQQWQKASDNLHRATDLHAKQRQSQAVRPRLSTQQRDQNNAIKGIDNTSSESNAQQASVINASLKNSNSDAITLSDNQQAGRTSNTPPVLKNNSSLSPHANEAPTGANVSSPTSVVATKTNQPSTALSKSDSTNNPFFSQPGSSANAKQTSRTSEGATKTSSSPVLITNSPLTTPNNAKHQINVITNASTTKAKKNESLPIAKVHQLSEAFITVGMLGLPHPAYAHAVGKLSSPTLLLTPPSNQNITTPPQLAANTPAKLVTNVKGSGATADPVKTEATTSQGNGTNAVSKPVPSLPQFNSVQGVNLIDANLKAAESVEKKATQDAPMNSAREGEAENSTKTSQPINSRISMSEPPAMALKAKNASTVSTAAGSTDLALTKVYRVGPNDVLDVRLNENQSQSTLFTVTPSGFLEHPMFTEPLPVAGLTVDEISLKIAADLKQRALADEPNVVVGVRDYASHNILISGLVRDAGTRFLRREAIPLYVVVADAQPLPEAAMVTVRRNELSRVYEIDLSNTAEMNLLVRPGDVITLRPNVTQFIYIGGEIKTPGEKTFRRGLTLMQAIIGAGGITPKSKVAEIGRNNENGFIVGTRFSLKEIQSGKTADPLLRPGDRIMILR